MPPPLVRHSFALSCVLVAGITTTEVQAATFTAKPAISASQVDYMVQGSFELPAIPASPGIVQNPTPSVWTFGGLSGYFTNGSPWGNPPVGTQALYIMDASSVSQTLTLPGGRLSLSVRAAVHNSDDQIISVRLDGNEIGRIAPTSAVYSTYVFDALLPGAGSHTLSFVGLTPGNKVAFLDDLKLVSVVAGGRNWSDPNTWDLGSVPTASDDVKVPADAVVLLDGTALAARNISVEGGELHCGDYDVGLSAESIVVEGRFVCGSPYSRYTYLSTLTLRGVPNAGSASGMGNKVLAAMPPGVIELHGEQRISWVQLSQNAAAGQKTLTLASPVDWKAGDEIVIAPSREVKTEGERATIASVTLSGLQLTLLKNLAYAHHGQQYTYTSGGNSWTVDERAEVGLLSRNIRIVGDDDPATSDDDTFGGHVMTMAGTTIHASGIELYRMGQKALKARYPFHWHMVGNAPGQYIVNSSVHESFNRCITVHQTNRVRVADNVCYDFLGHGYFLEDGNEEFNVFDGNLAVMARRPAKPPEGLPHPVLPLLTDYRDATASNGPAAFWISHPNNTYTNNVAAGSEGTGFWYHLEHSLPTNARDPSPNLAPFGTFDGNRVHSSRQGFSSCLGETGMDGIDTPATINDLSVNHTDQGIWPCGNNGLGVNTTFNRAIVANSRNGMQAPHPMDFNDSLFVAYTPNESPEADPLKEIPWFAISLYDQGFRLDDVHFVNYQRRNMSVFLNARAAHKLPVNYAQGLTFQNSPNLFRDIEDHAVAGNPVTYWSDAVHDNDGSLLGLIGSYALVPDHPLMTDASCLRPAALGTDGFACPYRYSHFRFELNGAAGNAAPVTVLRSDGAMDSTIHELFPTRFMHNFIVNGPYRYSYRFDQGIRRNEVWFWQLNGNPGDETVHELMDVPPTMEISPFAPWSAATSLSNLLSGPASRYYYRPESASLFVKMAPAGAPRFANQLLGVCMNPLVSYLCVPGNRGVTPPSVRITSSPTHTAGGSLIVTADVDSPLPVEATYLFMDDDDVAVSSSGSQSSLPYLLQHTINPDPGVHVLKLTVHTTDGGSPPKKYSYTAIQRLVVSDPISGEPAPRIAITNFDDVPYGTYDAATVPALQFQIKRPDLRPSGSHAHWLDNAVDKGDVSSPITLSGLPGGWHKLDVAPADADHTVRPMYARRSIFLVKNNVIADFEDGIDPRGLLSIAGSSTSGEISFYQGVPRLSRNDGGADDFIYMALPYSTTTGTNIKATYSLDLKPGLSWPAYQRVRIMHEGPTFALYAKYTGAGWVQLPLAVATPIYGTITNRDFTLPPALAGDTVEKIELRHSESDLYCSTACTSPVQHIWSVVLLP